MNDWVVESPSFEEQLMNNRIVYLNQKGINEVVELIKNKDKEIERLNNILNEIKQCLSKNRVFIHGERNLAFELEDILERVDKE